MKKISKDEIEKRLEEIEEQLSYLYKKIEVCSYGNEELQEIENLEQEFRILENASIDYE